MQIAVLKSTIRFLGKQGYDYTIIRIRNKGFTVEPVDWQEADTTIKDEELELVQSNEYGKIYARDSFKDYMKLNPHIKEQVLQVLTKLDEF